MTTPTHLPYLVKLVEAVMTSTPTHPASGGWSMFTDGQGADSPLSEIENAESLAQSTVTDVTEVYLIVIFYLILSYTRLSRQN